MRDTAHLTLLLALGCGDAEPEQESSAKMSDSYVEDASATDESPGPTAAVSDAPVTPEEIAREVEGRSEGEF